MLKNRAMSVSNVIYTIEETLDVTYIPETPVSSPVSSPIPIPMAIVDTDDVMISYDTIYPATPSFIQEMENDVKINVNISERETELYLKALKKWKDYRKY
jgi:hypothetical protein